MCTRFHCEVEASQNSNRWPGGITEMNFSQLDFASDTLQRFPIGTFGVDLWLSIKKSNDILRGTLRLGKIRRESEYIPSLSTRKRRERLQTVLAGGFDVPSKGNAHEDDEELENGVLQIGKKPCAIPEYLRVVL